MFPKDARFICRKCLEQFMVPAAEFRSHQKTGTLRCPACGLEARDYSFVRHFFKYYPRLVNMIDALEIEGVRLTEVSTKAGIQNFLNIKKYEIIGVQFNCVECGQLFLLGVNKNWPVEAGDLRCSPCGVNPRVLIMKEFRAALDHVNDSQIDMSVLFCLDLFSFQGRDPLDFVSMLMPDPFVLKGGEE